MSAITHRTVDNDDASRWLLAGAGVAVPLAIGAMLASPSIAPVAVGLVMCVLLAALPRRVTFFVIAITLPYLYQFVPRSSTLFFVVLVALIAAGVRRVPRWLWPIAAIASVMVFRLLISPIIGGTAVPSSILPLVIPAMMAVLAVTLFASSEIVVPLATTMLGVPTLITAYEMASGARTHAAVEGGRLSGGMSTPAELGVFAAVMFATLWPIVLDRKPTDHKLKVFAPMLMALFCVIASGTRGALLALVVPPVVAAIVIRGPAAAVLRRGLIYLVGMALLLSPLAATLIARLVEVVTHGSTEFAARQTNTTLGIRAVAWEHLEAAYRNADFVQKLFGQGAGASERIIVTSFTNLHLPHNEYLRFLVDYGWVGIACFVAGLLAIAAVSVRAPLLGARFAAPLTAVLALLSLSFSDNPLLYAQALVIPFTAIGLLCRERRDMRVTGEEISPVTELDRTPAVIY
jgi:hypothetical protein